MAGDDTNGPYSGSARVFSGKDGAVLYTFNGDSYGEVFGWTELEMLTIDRARLVLQCHRIDQFVYIVGGEPDALDVEVVGDSAVFDIPGGHQVTLRREDGIWYVDDFD